MLIGEQTADESAASLNISTLVAVDGRRAQLDRRCGRFGDARRTRTKCDATVCGSRSASDECNLRLRLAASTIAGQV